MRKIAVLNQKGGVGKTTTVANTAAALAQSGHRVVALDLDPQSHLTIHLGLEPETLESGSYPVLTGTQSFEEAIMLVRPNLWVLPANIHLVGAESELVSVVKLTLTSLRIIRLSVIFFFNPMPVNNRVPAIIF